LSIMRGSSNPEPPIMPIFIIVGLLLEPEYLKLEFINSADLSSEL